MIFPKGKRGGPFQLVTGWVGGQRCLSKERCGQSCCWVAGAVPRARPKGAVGQLSAEMEAEAREVVMESGRSWSEAGRTSKGRTLGQDLPDLLGPKGGPESLCMG